MVYNNSRLRQQLYTYTMHLYGRNDNWLNSHSFFSLHKHIDVH